MSSFQCQHCGAAVVDDGERYVKGCEHYPVDIERKNKHIKDGPDFVYDALLGRIKTI